MHGMKETTYVFFGWGRGPWNIPEERGTQG